MLRVQTSRGNVVAALLPPGFERYLRVFHPFVPWDADPDAVSVDERRSWEEIASEAGVRFGPTLTWRQLEEVLPLSPDGQSRPWAVWEGTLDRATSAALLGSLNDPPSTSYFFAFGLAAIVAVDEHRPLMYKASSLDAWGDVVERVRKMGVRAATPEYVWPIDQSWIVCTDYDLTSTYMAASHHVAERVMQHPVIEAVDVHLNTRVDDAADEQGPLA